MKFLGYRNFIADLCRASDVFVSVSLQEGLPVSVIEAMACGLLIVVSDIHGHRDNMFDGENGFLFAPGDRKRMCDDFFDIYKSTELRECFSKNSVEFAKRYDLKSIRLKMAKVYNEVESWFS